MPARTLAATAVTSALLLLPVTAHAGGPEPAATSDAPATRSDEDGGSVAAAGRTGNGPTSLPADSVVVLGLVVLVGAAVLVVLTGRRPDDDEPTD